jgi:hypothetical protein
MKSAERLAAEVCGNPNRGVRVPELLAEMRGGHDLQLCPVDVPREALECASATADHKLITGVKNAPALAIEKRSDYPLAGGSSRMHVLQFHVWLSGLASTAGKERLPYTFLSDVHPKLWVARMPAIEGCKDCAESRWSVPEEPHKWWRTDDQEKGLSRQDLATMSSRVGAALAEV